MNATLHTMDFPSPATEQPTIDKPRRKFLRNSMLGATGFGLAARCPGIFAAGTKSESEPQLHWLEISESLALVQGAGANVLVQQGADAVVMIDGGRAEHAALLLDFIAGHCGGRLPSLLFNSHWHWDQIGCNSLLRQQGADVIAHENTRLWLTTDVISRWQNNKIYPRRQQQEWPNKTFYWDSQHLAINGEKLQYGLLQQAHTDGDIYVKFQRANVIFVGDVIAADAYPIVDYCSNGWIGGMANALQKLLQEMDEDTKVIASTGGILNKADVQVRFELCNTLVRRIAKSYYSGSTFEEFVASKPTREYDTLWGDPNLFLYTSHESVWGHIWKVRAYL